MGNDMAPDLSGLVPFMYAFIAVAVVGAVVSLVVIGQEVQRFVVTHQRARLARRESIPAYYRRLLLPH